MVEPRQFAPTVSAGIESCESLVTALQLRRRKNKEDLSSWTLNLNKQKNKEKEIFLSIRTYSEASAYEALPYEFLP